MTWQNLGQHAFLAFRQTSCQAKPEARARGSACVMAEIPHCHIDLVVLVGALRALSEHVVACRRFGTDMYYSLAKVPSKAIFSVLLEALLVDPVQSKQQRLIK